LDTSESRSEISEIFLNVLFEKDGEDQLDPSCEKLISNAMIQGGEKCPAYNKKKEG
jgi:hypothetical protein